MVLRLSTFQADVRGVLLSGLSTATNAAIAATDSVLAALGKLQAQLANYAPLSGATFTGAVSGTTFTGSGAITTNNALIVSAPATGWRQVLLETSGSPRWDIYADSAAESGSNAGSNFYISNYSDSGVFISNALSINRANGNTTIGAALNVGGNLIAPYLSAQQSTFGSASLYTSGNTTNTGYIAFFNPAAVRQGYIGYGNAGGQLVLGTEGTTTGWIVQSNNAGTNNTFQVNNNASTTAGTQARMTIATATGNSYGLFAVTENGSGASTGALTWGSAVTAGISIGGGSTSTPINFYQGGNLNFYLDASQNANVAHGLNVSGLLNATGQLTLGLSNTAASGGVNIGIAGSYLGSNTAYNAGWKYLGTDFAWYFRTDSLTNDVVSLNVAPSGTAGAAMTPVQAFAVSQTGLMTMPVGITNTPIGASSPSTGAFTALTATSGNVFNDTGRNLIHNGLFRVQQRGAGAFTANGAYTADRWQLAFTTDTNSVTITTLSDTDRASIGDESATYALHDVVSSAGAAGSYSVVFQRIEDVRRLSNQSITVSFWANASAALNIGVIMSQNFGSGGTPSAQVNVTAQTVAATTTWTRYTLVFAIPSTSGKTLGTTANTSFTQLQFGFSSGSTNAAVLGVGVQSGTFQIWGVQLEIGTLATALEKPDIALELQNCQRFYQTGGGTTSGYGPAGSTFYVTVPFSTRMRAAPTVVNTPSGGSNYTSAPSYLPEIGSYQIVITITALGGAALNYSYTATADL